VLRSHFSVQNLGELLDDLTHVSALQELAVLAGCLGLAWFITWQVRRSLDVDGDVMFGRRIVDGALFPLLALVAALLANEALHSFMKPALFRLAIPVLISLAAIRLTARVLSAAFPASRWAGAVERTVSWIAWAAVVLWVSGVLQPTLEQLEDWTWKLGGATLSLRNIVEGTVIAGLVLVLTLWLSAALERKLLRNADGASLSMRKMVANLLRVLLLIVGLLVALSAVGIDLTALSVLGGAIGVGVGLGLQKIAANYVSGFVILAERSLRIGDMVKVDTFEGRITDIRTRYTVIRALNGREALVPNEMLITQRVENSTLADRAVLISNPLQVAYGTDLPTVLPQLDQTMASVARVLTSPAPSAQLAGFGADGLDLMLNFWIADPENGQGNVRSEVNLAVLRRLDELGVEIPFPQRVLRHAAAARPGAETAPGAPPAIDAAPPALG
jgi:small-conductance mechanosensitive channel